MLDIDTRVALLCTHFTQEKPVYRTVLSVAHPTTGKPVVFKPGRFLLSLAVPGSEKRLSAANCELLHKMEWFGPWIRGIAAQRSAGPQGAEPNLLEKVELLCSEYATGPRPKAKDVRTVTRGCGKAYALDAHRLLEKVAPNWFGVPNAHCALDAEHKQKVEALPWAGEWIALGRQRREVAKFRKIFTKEDKLGLLAQLAAKPCWNDVLPQRVPQEHGGGMWEFRPAWFLDDLINNWLEGRPGVVLSEEQKRGLEALPWVLPWVQSMRETRKRKRKRSVSLK